MESNYPVLPSLSTLFSDYDEFNSAVPTTADSNPTFYKPGESSRVPEINSTFHSPPTDDAFKIWRSLGLPHNDNQSYPSSSSSSTPYHQMSNECGEWMQGEEMDVTMEKRCYDEEPYFSQASLQYADTQRPTWASMSCVMSSIPTSAAPSSLDSQSRQSASGVSWLRSHREQEHEPFGSEPPPTLGASFDTSAYLKDKSRLFHPGPQPHNHHRDPTQSPYSYALTASSSAPSSTPTVSPFASSASPASLSTSSSPSPDIIIHTPTVPLHQPRPGRPIPIIPLSKLASACEEYYMPPSSTRATFPKSEVPAINLESSDLILSPLSPEFRAQYAPFFSPKLAPLHDKSIENASYFSYGDNFDENYAAMNHPRYPYFDGSREIFCACGCMESYRIPHDSTI